MNDSDLTPPGAEPSLGELALEDRAALRRVARAGDGWHTFNRSPEDLAGALHVLDRHLEDQGRERSEVTVTVCPYFQPLDAEVAGRYDEAGADAVAALLLPLDADSVRAQLDGLAPVLERAAAGR